MIRRLISLPIVRDITPYLAVDVLHELGRHFFVADLDVDSDGPGGSKKDDPWWQPETTLRYKGKSIDSRKVAGIVLPPGVIIAAHGIVLGCKARLTDTRTGRWTDAVVYDVGPTRKLGEGSVKAVADIGINSNPKTGGEDSYDAVLYEFWPGVPAVVDGITYDLQPYRA